MTEVRMISEISDYKFESILNEFSKIGFKPIWETFRITKLKYIILVERQ